MRAPTVEIVIPVHSMTRPIARAVSSVLASRYENLKVSVVCHNVDALHIAPALGTFISDSRLNLDEILGSAPTAASPRNYAIERSMAEYIGFLDSDDEFEAGALDEWVKELGGSPDLLIGQLSSDSSGRIQAPSPRRGRFESLDPVKDFLNYRTAPLGVLIRREVLLLEQCPKYRTGLQTGEDIALGLFLWNYAQNVRYSRARAGYRVREDGLDRVTGQQLSPTQQFEPVLDALSLHVIKSLGLRRRQSIAVKLFRTQVMGYLLGKLGTGSLDDELIVQASVTLNRLLDFAPGTLGFLEWSEVRMIRAIQAGSPAGFVGAMHSAEAIPSYLKLFTYNPLRTLSPEGSFDREKRSNYLTELFQQ